VERGGAAGADGAPGLLAGRDLLRYQKGCLEAGAHEARPGSRLAAGEGVDGAGT